MNYAMNERIVRVEVRDRIVTPATSEVTVVVRVRDRTDSTHLRGRFAGPRCLFASTVEVAYPLRPLPSSEPDELMARVIIPEASLWDTQSPFLYAGPVEVWEGDRLCDVVHVRHGLRVLRFGSTGISLNGRPIAVRGKRIDRPLREKEALQLRKLGYNLLVTPVSAETIATWDIADRVGFLVTGRITSADGPTGELIDALSRHPCSAGWLAKGVDLPVKNLISEEAMAALGPID
jgi:beta-galactosidase/beta-glucuronidase